jgi:hypothetical protein
MEEILEFLDKAEAAGQSVPSVVGMQVDLASADGGEDQGTHTVAFEARQLKMLYLRLFDN